MCLKFLLKKTMTILVSLKSTLQMKMVTLTFNPRIFSSPMERKAISVLLTKDKTEGHHR